MHFVYCSAQSILFLQIEVNESTLDTFVKTWKFESCEVWRMRLCDAGEKWGCYS